MRLRLIDIVSPTRWKFVSIFLLKKVLRWLEPGDHLYIEPFEIEQLAMRFFDDECKTCVAKGECIACGCHTVGRMNGWDDSCSKGNWGPMLSKDNWEHYVDQFGIEFKIVRKPKGNDFPVIDKK